jgi:hypothetical protein
MGSVCAATGSINAFLPGAIVAGRRASWEIVSVKVKDATGATFAVPGTFYP